MEGTTLALGDHLNISDNTLPFGFLVPAVQAFEFPDPESFIVGGSLSGPHAARRLLVDDDAPGTDDLQLDLTSGLMAGETLALAAPAALFLAALGLQRSSRRRQPR